MNGRRRGRANQGGPPVDPAERAREIALRLLDHSPRSCAQLREGLLAREVDPEVAEQVIQRYVEVGLLDDGALAATIVRTRHRERGQSRRAIHQELRRKGFDASDIESALDQIGPEDESVAAHALAEARWRRLAGQDDQTRVRRVVAMLGRKGYPPSLAFEVVRALQRADNVGGST
ncbi:regulatory protein RecX [Demequina capsici]|uniref:Regulatory protein RecX n=1 Tax=Demequina capsici TaxID=3075620 RepID=A0AA96F3M9_9MICO|nr:regulatory protein RecX [Demequina sp. OYTSA14]WNM23376.1 regulatory protein RecX [Demequina sp. OYTSA14]